MSVGHRGVWLTVGHGRRRATVGLPGTGLYWTESHPLAPPVHGGHQFAFALVAVLIAAAAWWALHG